MSDRVFRTVHTLEAAAHALSREPIPSGGEAADLLGRVRAVETKLADYRRSILAEETTAEGEHYAIVTEQKGQRSFNTGAILSSVYDKGLSLQDLIAAGAVKLSYTWTRLEHFFRAHDMELSQVGHEIEDVGDVDGPHVGSVWKPYTRVIAREKE